MLRFRFDLTVVAVSLLSALLSFSVQAQETAIISPAPKATCTSVPGHWDGAVWVTTHDVCKYENRIEGVAWVNDYWSCTAATADGTNCTTWVLVPGHWVKTLE